MMGYLPKAVAIVFVLNVANAGGIQQDRVFIYFSSAISFYSIHLFSFIYQHGFF